MIGCEAQELRYGLRRDHLLDIAQTQSENGDSANQLGMADGHLNSRGAAKALAEEIGLPNTVIEAQNNTIKRVDFCVAKAKLYERLRGQLNERQDKVIARMFREGIDGFGLSLTSTTEESWRKIAMAGPSAVRNMRVPREAVSFKRSIPAIASPQAFDRRRPNVGDQ
jgi:hypothetical protein